jgi:ketosteroid isomerase-like protein
MMTRVLVAVVAAGLSSTSLLAQPATEPRHSDERTLLRLEDSWATALVRRDAATFRRLLADGFVYSENDRTMTRDEVLRDMVGGPETVEAAHNEDMRVHRFGRTAAVTGWLIVRGHGPQGTFERRYRFTDTWLRRDGRWQIVAAHDYLAPAAPR